MSHGTAHGTEFILNTVAVPEGFLLFGNVSFVCALMRGSSSAGFYQRKGAGCCNGERWLLFTAWCFGLFA